MISVYTGNRLKFLSGGGEMGELTRKKDWSKTSVGHPDTWSQSLCTTLGIVLNSKFPMFLFWGPELICFYNDAYRPSLGEHGKHPAILGQPGEQAWPEIWAIIQPLIEQVKSAGEATWSEDQLIPIYRNNSLEDVYWTFSYSPVYDENGNIAGVLVTCNETTLQVKNRIFLEESNKRYYENLAQAPIAICVLRGPQHIVEIANAPMLELMGVTAEQILHKPIFEGLPEAGGQGLEQVADMVFNTAEKFSATERAINLPRHGKVETTYIDFTIEALKDSHGTVSGVMAIANEVTLQVLARKKIEESEKRFRNIADNAPVLIWMSDTEKNRVFFNTAWLNFTGRSLEQEYGAGWAQGVHPEDAEKCLHIYAAAYETREVFHVEYRLRRHDAEYRWISGKGVPRFSIDGTFEGYLGACMDIHEQVLFQRNLKADEERHNIIIAASELGTWELNLKSREVQYSDRYLEIFGYKDRIELSHEQLLAHLHPDDHGIREAAFQEAFKTGVLQYESRLIWLDQSIHWMKGKGKVFFDDDNQPFMLMGTVQDITEEKNYQQMLKDREQKFRLLADSMPQFVWTGDINGVLNYFNRSVFDYSGMSPEQVMNGGWLEIVHPDDQEENVKAWMLSVSTGQDFLFEHRFRRADGIYRWQLSRAIPQKDESGNIRMWVGTSTDIEDQKVFTQELEKQVKERTKMLQESNEKLESSVAELQKMNADLQSFAYVSSHDLQEPLRKIQTFAGKILLKEYQNLSDTGKDYFLRMQSAAKRMQTLIEDLLTYSRTGTTERIFVRTKLQDIISEVLLELQETITEKQATIRVGELSTASLIPFQFKQLMQNLIGNALKFSKPGITPLILIDSKMAMGNTLGFPVPEPEKMYCHLTVSDNGIGFDEQYKERIFEVFQRLHGKNEFKGTGIGLAIVKKIVENHNGMIFANGRVNEGASFDIYFPAS